MKRAGFTMIELVFVIVILGILAAVAVPKLAATRTDAKVSKDATDISTALSDIGASYTSQGKLQTVGKMTNVSFVTTKNGTTDAKDTNLSNNTVYYNDSTGKSCLSFKGSSTDGNVTIASESNATSECKGLNTAVSKLEKVHVFGGSGVSY